MTGSPPPPARTSPHTEAAARWFQTNNGLTSDGIVGNRTWRQLVDAQG
ncbi:peptidoglycan-binding domain-containing protein [Streptomyces sp. NPDC001759]